MSPTIAQAIWRDQTVPFVRKQMTYTGVVGKYLGQFSFGPQTFQISPSSTHLDLPGGMYVWSKYTVSVP